jgi:hypothetical protein
MGLIVTRQKTLSFKNALIPKFQTPRHRVVTHYEYIKVYQMSVVNSRALRRADAVGVVTG